MIPGGVMRGRGLGGRRSGVRATSLVLALLLFAGCFVGGKREKRADGDTLSSVKEEKTCREGSMGISEKEQEQFRALVTSGKPRSGGILRIHTEVEPAHLQPLLRPDAWVVRMVQGDVFEALVARDAETHAMKGVLAESWTYDEKAQTYTFELRKGVLWHDGKPFTSKDVVFTFDLLMTPSTMAVSMRSSLEEVDFWKADGPTRVILHVTRPNFLFLQNLEGLPILPQHVYATGDINAHPANRAPVGTGPFKFKQWWEGKQIAFVRNERYWGESPWLDEVDYVIHRDRSVAFQLLKKGDIDLMPRIDANQYFEYDGDEVLRTRYNRVAFDAPDFSFFMFNTGRAIFADVGVRRAMAMLLDLEKIRFSVHRCLARIVTGPWPFDHPAYNHDIQPYPYDPAGAEALLAGAGWKDRDGDGIRDKGGTPMKFTFIIPSQSKDVQRMATIYQEDLKKAGVAMDISLQDWSIYVELCKKHDFDMAAMMWDMEWENDLYGLFHTRSITGGQNFPGWSNAEADTILEKGRMMLDDGQRNALFKRLHKILHDEVPYIFAFSPVEAALVKKNLRGDGLLAGIKWFRKNRIWIE
jgi:peptide/nickel transport system substrate-binding protein